MIQRIKNLTSSTKASIFYGAVALSIMAPLLAPGYIFATDMVFTPSIILPPISDPSFTFMLILWILHLLIPVSVLQKIILLGIFFSSGFGMHQLIITLKPKTYAAKYWTWAAYFAGFLYAVNPFAYSRFVAGQWIFLLGYALLPLVAITLFKFCSRPDFLRGICLALLTWFILAISLHAALPILIISLMFLAQAVLTRRADKHFLYSLLKWSIISAAIFLLLCSTWLLPVLTGHGQTIETLNNFSSTDSRAFATDAAGLGVFGNLLAMNGFWADSANLYLAARDAVSWWIAPIIALWGLTAFGLYQALRAQRSFASGFLAILAAGILLAAGTASFVAPINNLLLNHLPFFTGYRESQKLACLIVFAFAYFGAFGVYRICAKVKFKDIAITILLCLPALSAPLIFWGAHGQLKTSNYPVEWQAVNDRLDAECADGCKTLFLPWHMYMRYGFAERVIATPAPKFFGSYIIASNDPELAGATAYPQTPAQLNVQAEVLPKLESGDAGAMEALKNQNINFILLAKENDYKKYDYLNQKSFLKIALDTPTLILYEVIN